MASEELPSLDAELLLTELEARIASELDRRIEAGWRGWRQGRNGLPPWPAELGQPRLLRQLDEAIAGNTDPVLVRRAEVARNLARTAAFAARCPAPADVAARNRAARELGAPDFYALSLELQCVSEAQVEQLLAVAPAPRLRQSAAPLVAALDRASPPTLLERARAVLERRGFGVRGAAVTFSPGAASRTFAVRPPGDVRCVVGALHGPAGWRALWHELGHAFASVSVDPRLPWPLSRVAARCLDEGVAERTAMLGEEAEVLAEVLDLPQREAAAVAENLESRRVRWYAWQRGRAAFERALYQTPSRARRGLWVELLEAHTGEDVAPEGWREVSHFRTDPGAQAIYLLAGDIGERLMPCSGSDLRRVLQHGARLRWPEVMAALERDLPRGHDSSAP